MSMVPFAAPAFLLTRQPRQSLPCADQAFPLTRQPRQSFPCADLALLLTRRIKIRPSYVRGSLCAREDCGTLFCHPEGLRDTHGLRYGLIVTCTRSSVCVGRQKSALMNWISDQYGLYFL